MKKTVFVCMIPVLALMLLCGCGRTEEDAVVPVVVEDSREDTSLPRSGAVWDYLDADDAAFLRAADGGTIASVGYISAGEDGQSAFISYDASVIEQALTALGQVTLGEQSDLMTADGDAAWYFFGTDGTQYRIDFNGENFCAPDGTMYVSGGRDALERVLGLMEACDPDEISAQQRSEETAPEEDAFALDPEDGVQSVLSDDWSYDRVVLADGTEELTFNQQVVIAIPADWAGLYTMEADEYGVRFYHTASLQAWRDETGEDIGLLFMLNFTSEASETLEYLPDYEILGENGGGVYYLTFPTDVQAYIENEEIAAEYLALFEGTQFIRTTSGVMVG